MKTLFKILLLLLCTGLEGWAQSFTNLNFERAIINTSGAPQFEIVASNAIPGWIAYGNGSQLTYIVYDTISLGEASVDLLGTNNDAGYPPIQGKYFIDLQPNSAGQPSQSVAIGQTGQIPAASESLTFWGNFNGPITFDGIDLSYNVVGSSSNGYSIYAANISPYAGETGQLLFTATENTGGFIDNIQFSPGVVPEPGALALGAMGGVLLAWRGRKKS